MDEINEDEGLPDEFFVYSEDFIVRKYLLAYLFEMLNYRKKVQAAYFNKKNDLPSFDMWAASITQLYALIRTKMIKEDERQKKKENKKYVKTIEYLDKLTNSKSRPSFENIQKATTRIVEFMEELGLTEIQKSSRPSKAVFGK